MVQLLSKPTVIVVFLLVVGTAAHCAGAGLGGVAGGSGGGGWFYRRYSRVLGVVRQKKRALHQSESRDASAQPLICLF